MSKYFRKTLTIVFALTMIMTAFAFVQPVNAASKPDLKKANVKWDLKNNKTIKFKTKWSILGVKKHTVKMTKFKVKNAKKKGYKECTFTLTFNKKISPTKSQVNDMYWLVDGSNGGSNAPFGGEVYFTVVDYKTGKSLEGKNNKGVKVTSSWKYTKFDKKYSKDGFWIEYPKKTTVKVKITYPKKYKNLAIGVGGYTDAPKYVTEISGGSASGYVSSLNLKAFWSGKKAFSKETKLYSKKDKNFAHFMRVKK